MKTIITLVFIIYNLLSIGQSFTKSTQDYKAKNGQVFKVGDKIILASPADFSNEYIYYTQGKDMSIKNKATGRIKVGNSYSEYDNRYKSLTIKHFKTHPVLGTYAVTDKVFNEMVNIEEALNMGEIVSTNHLKAIINNSIPMTDSIAYLRMLNQIGSISDEKAKEFLYRFDNKNYNRIREDEFEFHSYITETIEKINKTTINKIFNDTLKTFMKITIGNYDFKRKGFPLIWDKSNGAKILNTLDITPEDVNKNRIDLTDLRMFFLNIQEKFNFLPLNKEKANFLIKYRKDNTGKVNRDLFMYVSFQIKAIEIIDNSRETTNLFTITRTYETPFTTFLKSKIISISFFEDNKLYNFLNRI